MGLYKLARNRGFRNFMARLYGWGASVVIVGVLFKLVHWPYADYILIVGLLTEAVIFFFSAFEQPHVDPDWSLVYPELHSNFHGNGKGFEGGSSSVKKPKQKDRNPARDHSSGDDIGE